MRLERVHGMTQQLFHPLPFERNPDRDCTPCNLQAFDALWRRFDRPLYTPLTSYPTDRKHAVTRIGSRARKRACYNCLQARNFDAPAVRQRRHIVLEQAGQGGVLRKMRYRWKIEARGRLLRRCAIKNN